MQNTYRLPIGAVVGQAFSIYFSNLIPFLLLSVLVNIPWIAILYGQHAAATQSQTMISLMPLLHALGNQLLVGALTFAIVQRLRGVPVSMGQILTIGVKSLPRVLLVTVCMCILLGIGLLLLVFPALIVMTVYYVTVPAVVLENKGMSAFPRSADLTRGTRWEVFGAALMFALLTNGVPTVINMYYQLSAADAPLWLYAALAIVFGPLGATLPAICYYRLRMGKENADAAQIAAVFD